MNWHLKNKKSILHGMLFFVLFSCPAYAMYRPRLLYDEANYHIDVYYDTSDEQSMNVTLEWDDRYERRYSQDGLLTDDKNRIMQGRSKKACKRIEYLYDPEDDTEFYFLPTSARKIISSHEQNGSRISHDDSDRCSSDEEPPPLPPLSSQDEAFAQSRRDDEFDILNKSEIFQFPPAADEKKSPIEFAARNEQSISRPSSERLESDEEYSFDFEMKEYENKREFIFTLKKRRKRL